MSNIVEKLINNKFFLFLISNLPYLTFLLYVYNANFVGQNNGQILFYEILFLFFLTVFINYIICSFLYRILKGNIHKVFFIDMKGLVNRLFRSHSLNAFISGAKDGFLNTMINDWKWIFSYSGHFKILIIIYTILGLSGLIKQST